MKVAWKREAKCCCYWGWREGQEYNRDSRGRALRSRSFSSFLHLLQTLTMRVTCGYCILSPSHWFVRLYFGQVRAFAPYLVLGATPAWPLAVFTSLAKRTGTSFFEVMVRYLLGWVGDIERNGWSSRLGDGRMNATTAPLGSDAIRWGYGE